MASNVHLKISASEFKYSGFESLKNECGQILPNYSVGLSKLIDSIRVIDPLATEERNFILRIYTEDTDILLVWFRVKGGFGKRTRTEHMVRHGEYSLSKQGSFQKFVGKICLGIKSLSISLKKKAKQVAESKGTALFNQTCSKIKDYIIDNVFSNTITKTFKSIIGELFLQGLSFVGSSFIGFSFPPGIFLAVKSGLDLVKTGYDAAKLIYKKASEKINEIKAIYTTLSEEEDKKKVHRLSNDCRVIMNNTAPNNRQVRLLPPQSPSTISENYLQIYSCTICGNKKTNYLTQFSCCNTFYCYESCHNKKCNKSGNKRKMACWKCHFISDWSNLKCPKCQSDSSSYPPTQLNNPIH